MDGLYWLIFLVIAAAIGFYIRYWYYRPSGIPDILSASYSYQALDYMNTYARREELDPEDCDISINVIKGHLKDRDLDWRERNDVIRFMKKIGWIHEFNDQGVKFYRLSRTGKQELETANGLGEAVKAAAQALHDQRISGDQAKAVAAAVVAAHLRVQSRSDSSENGKRAESSADQIEEAARTRDPDKIDRTITRTKDILQIMTYSLPFARDIFRILGL